jgi:hypothetical protein
MSNITTYYTAQETSDDIPYHKYFEFFSYENWSLQHYVQLIINNYANAEKSKAHHTFFSILYNINKNLHISQEIRDIAQRLVDNKNVSIYFLIY